MINGIINVYKEKGFTSHDVVAKLRGIVGQKKIGHTGTLDPDAEGVLPICLGRATKLCDLLTEKDKTYETVLLFGVTTDTQDISGTILEEKSVEAIDEEKVKECIQGYIGEYEQLPPMYSALKVNGKKLYELARQGIEVERKTRRVQIHGIRILEMKLPRVRMEIQCSKGTYIRTLCHDIGQELGCGACMEQLLRTKVSNFELADGLRLSQIQEAKEAGNLRDCIRPLDKMFEEFSAMSIQPEKTSFAYNGNPLCVEWLESMVKTSEESYIRVYDEAGRFIGLYYLSEDGREYRLKKMFFDPEEI